MRPWAKFFGDPITAHHLLTNCPKFYQLLCGSNPLTTVAKSKGNLELNRSLVGQINALLMPPWFIIWTLEVGDQGGFTVLGGGVSLGQSLQREWSAQKRLNRLKKVTLLAISGDFGKMTAVFYIFFYMQFIHFFVILQHSCSNVPLFLCLCGCQS